MQFRKVVQYVRLRFVPFLVAGVILVSPLSLCANAAVWEGNAILGYVYWGSTNGVGYLASKDIVLPSSGATLEETVNQRTSNGMRLDLGEVKWTKPLKVYISGFYFNTHSAATITEVGQPWNANNYEIKFTDEKLDSTGAIGIDGISVFVPNYEATFVGDGLSLVASLNASEENPVTNVVVRPYVECGWKRTGSSSLQGFWYWTSVRVISAETSAELDELNNIAQQIVAGNETLEAMLGDVVGLLQQIYVITGDIEIAADRTVDLLNTMLDYVDGIEGQLTDIYGLLSGFFTSITKLLRDQHSELMGSLADFQIMVENRLYEIYAELSGNGTNGEITEGVQNQIQEGNLVQEGLGELERPDYENFELELDGFKDQFTNGDLNGGNLFSSIMSVFFGNNMISAMLMISLTFTLAAYVLYGKR